MYFRESQIREITLFSIDIYGHLLFCAYNVKRWGLCIVHSPWRVEDDECGFTVLRLAWVVTCDRNKICLVDTSLLLFMQCNACCGQNVSYVIAWCIYVHLSVWLPYVALYCCQLFFSEHISPTHTCFCVDLIIWS